MKTQFKSWLCLSVITTLCITSLLAQQTIPTSGGDATGSGGSVSYSVGQVFYHTHSAAAGSVAEGVQQPFEIYIITSIEEAEGIELVVSVFPNPVINQLTLSVKETGGINLDDLSYQLLDMRGQPIRSEKVPGAETSINMAFLPPGNYFLKVLDGKREIRVFKIIKR